MASNVGKIVRVLIVEDNPGDAFLVSENLRDASPESYDTRIARSLAEGSAACRETAFDVILLDLSLPDSVGVGTVTLMRQAAPLVPIVVLTGNEDQSIALQALREGAQDYLIKGEAGPANLERSVRYAIERAMAERRLAERLNFEDALVNSVPSPLFVKDSEGRFIACNQAFAEMMGRTREQLIGVDSYALITSRDPEERRTADGRLLRDGGIQSEDTTVLWSDGRPRDVIIRRAVFRGPDGRQRGIVGVVSDVTRLKEQEKLLRENEVRLTASIQDIEESRERLQQQAERLARLTEQHALEKERALAADRSKSEFLATMSHEIRTPLTGVLGMADTLLAMALPAEAHNYVETIRESGQILLAILNDILDLSKLEAGRLEIEKVDFSLEELLDDLQTLLRPNAAGKGLRLDFAMAPEVPRAINGDPVRIRQVLFNLLGNAIKFTDAGHVNARVIVAGRSDGRTVLRFDVEDTGIGIAEDMRDKLFRRFSQADTSTARKFEGSGLGLAICKHLSELMGGEIGFTSVPGKGSLFWFTVPCAEATGALPERYRDHGKVYRAQRRLNLLVAEDNRINQLLLVTMLGNLGHRIELAANGLQAVEAVKRQPFDVILMDVRMPQMDGCDATRCIRRLAGPVAEVPILAVTADAMPEHRTRFFNAGVDGCVLKPIDRAELLEAINKVMGEEVHVAEGRDVRLEVDQTRKPTPAAESEAAAAEVDAFLAGIGDAFDNP